MEATLPGLEDDFYLPTHSIGSAYFSSAPNLVVNRSNKDIVAQPPVVFFAVIKAFVPVMAGLPAGRQALRTLSSASFLGQRNHHSRLRRDTHTGWSFPTYTHLSTFLPLRSNSFRAISLPHPS